MDSSDIAEAAELLLANVERNVIECFYEIAVLDREIDMHRPGA
jgi:hypothetical protein